MNRQALEETANAMVAPGRGILAMDESHPTCKRRFDSIGVDCNESSRRAYRGLLITAPGAAEHLSGYILFDETLRQMSDTGNRFPDIIAGRGAFRASRSTGARSTCRCTRGRSTPRVSTGSRSG